jgi:hypothetical protein
LRATDCKQITELLCLEAALILKQDDMGTRRHALAGSQVAASTAEGILLLFCRLSLGD